MKRKEKKDIAAENKFGGVINLSDDEKRDLLRRPLSSLENKIPIKGLRIDDIRIGFNNVVGFLSNPHGEHFVAKVMGPQKPASRELSYVAPSLDRSKIHKEVIVSKILSQAQFPTPAPIFFDSSQPNFAMYEWLSGDVIDFNAMRTMDLTTKVQFARSLAVIVGQLQNLQKGQSGKQLKDQLLGRKKLESSKIKHKNTFSWLYAHLVRHKLISPEIAAQVLQVFNTSWDKLPENNQVLVHGDIYTGNVLLDKEKQSIGIIDWSDSAEFDDPLTDIIMTARWIAFDGELTNYRDPKAQRVFAEFISTVNAVTNSSNHPQLCFELLPFYDVMWHLKTLATEYHKESKIGLEIFQKNLGVILSNSTSTR